MSGPVEDARPGRAARALDAESVAWVDALTGDGAAREASVERLYGVLLRLARVEGNRRSGQHGIAGRELDDLVHQAASDALVSILRKVEEFRGESKFTTWAYKFVVLEVSTKFGRHAWRRVGVHLDDHAWDRLPDRLGADPEDLAESRALVAAVSRAVAEELTPHQRRVFVAIVVEATPLDVLVAALDSNRNAIYKTLFDARRKLYRHLVAHGYLGAGEVSGR